MGVGDGKLHGGYAATLDSRARPENDGKKTSRAMTTLIRHSRRGRRPKAGIQSCGFAQRKRNGCVGRRTAWRLRRHSGFPSKLENDGKKYPSFSPRPKAEGGNPGLRFREAGAQWVCGTANCMAATPPLWIPELGPRMTGWGGFGLGLSQFSCGKCCRRGGFKAHCDFAFGESRNVDGYPPSPGMTIKSAVRPQDRCGGQR